MIITSKASWFCFMNSKPSPTCKVSLGLEYPTAMPGRYFLDAWITSYNTARVQQDIYWFVNTFSEAMINNSLLALILSLVYQLILLRDTRHLFGLPQNLPHGHSHQRNSAIQQSHKKGPPTEQLAVLHTWENLPARREILVSHFLF